MVDQDRIRFGGRDTPDGYLFELTGGNLALDLINTIVPRGAVEPRDLLPHYADVVNWSRQAGLLDPAGAPVLLAAARRSPRLAGRALRRILDLRETLHAVFRAAVPDDASLQQLQGYAEQSSQHRQLARDGSSVTWQWQRDGLDWMIWPIVDAATELLTGDRRSRVRVCASDTCGWLFIDSSPRGNRRWCDMTVCGNRAKARRHYARRASGHQN